MTPADVEATVLDVVRDRFGYWLSVEITPETRFIDDLNADAGDALMVLFELEDRLDVTILPPFSWPTVGALIADLQQRVCLKESCPETQESE